MGMSETYTTPSGEEIGIGSRVWNGCRSGVVVGFLLHNNEQAVAVSNGEQGFNERKELWPITSIKLSV